MEANTTANANATAKTIAGSSLEPGVADIILRSRQTLLDILEDRGYDTAVYQNIAPDQILTLAEGHPRALDVYAKKKADSAAPCERAVVVYQIQDRIRSKLGTFATRLFSEPPDANSVVTKADDIIVILNEPYHEAFDKYSLQQWQSGKVRMTFFHIKQVVVHPGRHVLVPPHRKLSADEAKAAMDRLHVTQKSQFPLIKHHDMQSRTLGLVPGDVVEILRPSPTAGISKILRICAA
jgi:DNA-directed RNA polymerase subunit H (RpoH/RPB5)